MIDTFNISDGGTQRQIFYAQGSNSFQVWQKPQNCKFVHFVLLGGGGGGGGGQGAGTGTARRGGGSGGSSPVTKGLFPASMIPNTLYIQVGLGGSIGVGGTSNTNGGSGSLSYVMVSPDTGKTAQNVLLQSGDSAAGGGTAGSAGGNAGSAGSQWTFTSNIFYQLGLVDTYGGQAGVLGQTTPVPTNLSISGITTAGAPGAGQNGATSQIGGAILGGGNIPTMSGGTAGGASNGGDGSCGYMTFVPNTIGYSSQPLIFLGGAGGGSSNAATGGNGGNGAYGCGGGGGGAGLTNSGGNGGKGGDGIVIITFW